jgi:hypothetical protein
MLTGRNHLGGVRVDGRLIKMVFKGIGFEDMDWIQLAQIGSNDESF